MLEQADIGHIDMQSEHNSLNNLKPSLKSFSLILISKYTNETFLGSLLLKQEGREDQQTWTFWSKTSYSEPLQLPSREENACLNYHQL